MMERPGWLEGLMGERFFGSCAVHQDRRKSEKNVFCLLCCFSLCTHCLPSHPSHPLLQVRRYVYHDVVRLDDLEKLIDCSHIQPYTINGGKVIFLNQRPQSRNYKGPSNICFHCDRTLQEPFHFCSLQCKVDHLLDQGVDLSSILYSFDGADFTVTQNFEDLRMDSSSEVLIDHGQATPSSSLEDHHLMHHLDYQYKDHNSTSCTSSEAECNTLGASHDAHQTTTTRTTTTVKTKNKRSGNKLISGIVLSLSNRRKGAPHRAPLS
ncbi:uncharacterized protein LOC104440620 [Eucalyptus grandis]|uniref:uncharacterized protein LOC104440620 n=1 Tax=Eucalyptus grandis TaxID=71139 RepID=UPI00192EE0AF|nr:uncharacterized protein LOC104440620 [Eucalyptus grandis]